MIKLNYQKFYHNPKKCLAHHTKHNLRQKHRKIDVQSIYLVCWKWFWKASDLGGGVSKFNYITYLTTRANWRGTLRLGPFSRKAGTSCIFAPNKNWAKNDSIRNVFPHWVLAHACQTIGVWLQNTTQVTSWQKHMILQVVMQTCRNREGKHWLVLECLHKAPKHAKLDWHHSYLSLEWSNSHYIWIYYHSTVHKLSSSCSKTIGTGTSNPLFFLACSIEL